MRVHKRDFFDHIARLKFLMGTVTNRARSGNRTQSVCRRHAGIGQQSNCVLAGARLRNNRDNGDESHSLKREASDELSENEP